MVVIRAFGDWPQSAVHATWTRSGRRIVPEVEEQIERTWREASRRLGERLFDGPACRLERWSASPESLDLVLSRTSYKPFLGTNLHHAHLADVYGGEILANPVGVSTALETSDGWLLLGRRNDSVAYYPNRIHPFAGALEPPKESAQDLDVFADLLRELREELDVGEADIRDLRCIGLMEDRTLRQPELVFRTKCRLSREEVEGRLDREEHHETFAVRATPEEVERAMRDRVLTPVAWGTLALWGRGAIGENWFWRMSGEV